LKRAEWVTAGKQRKCYHHGDKRIEKGEPCLEVKEDLTTRGYCEECAFEMFEKARQELDDLQRPKP
jgi:hypothetical protein